LSAFASRAAQTAGIQSMQFMLLGTHPPSTKTKVTALEGHRLVDHYHAAHRAIGLFELIEAQSAANRRGQEKEERKTLRA
jgi:hypothetical protein